MSEKNIIVIARFASILLTPFYLPVIGVGLLFSFSYLNNFPIQAQVILTVTVYLFTVLFPSLLIRAYRKHHGWTLIQLGRKERRIVPYIISIICYACCYTLMVRLHLPHLITSILVASLVIQILCAIINMGWKISTHTAGTGGVVGALIAFSFMLNFNPFWWLCLSILVSGIVGSSRIILRQHSLTQVTAGFFLGIMTAFVTIVLV
ncbi:MAG: phosphatase PAP2 family protein [Prevotella sp.]|nr:phosphatase PAP2 family protein [Prevotella sp.]MDD7272852.1 phosphatase PAP2 family protein [Prevotellaceae bacterium]MDY3935286.1 phosphatase PAP2 family protein [Prevotella sp.]MDY4217350.1 phosphatase PAP2 family protein [Prevotella sp.]